MLPSITQPLAEFDRVAEHCVHPGALPLLREGILLRLPTTRQGGVLPISDPRASLSAQVVPDASTAAVLVEGAAFDQCPEVLLECVAASPGQFDGLADGDATMLAGKFDNL